MLQEQVRTLCALNMNYIDEGEGELGAEEAAEATEGGDGADGGADGADAGGAGGAQLERLLYSKNRRLEAELVSIRNELHGAQAGLSGNERHSQSLERIVSEQRRLIEQLEEEAAIKVQAAAGEAPGAEGGAGGGDGGAELIRALADQRDRAKERVQRQEEEMAAEREEHRRALEEVRGLKDDNVKLFEKLKYVEQYRQSPSRAGPAPGAGRDLEARYNKMYDDRVNASNPFEEFRGRERSIRQSKSLHYHDRVALSGVRLLLSNRVTRAGLMLYLGVLHLLVMASLLRRHHACHDAIALHHSEAPLVSGGGITGNGLHFP